MVDLYSQIYAQPDIEGDLATMAETLRTAYVGETPSDRMAAIRKLWDGAADDETRYSRHVLTAYAAARMPVSDSFADDAPELIASMLSAGLISLGLMMLTCGTYRAPATAHIAADSVQMLSL